MLICEDYLNSFYNASEESKNLFTIKIVILPKTKKLTEKKWRNYG